MLGHGVVFADVRHRLHSTVEKGGNDFQIRCLLTVYIAEGAKMVQSVMYGPRIDLQISK